MDASTLLLVSVAAMVVVLIVAAMKQLLSGSSRMQLKEKPRLPPGSTGLPLIGETLRLLSMYRLPNPELFIFERMAQHGAMFTTHVFGERTVFSANPAFNRLVLNGEGRIADSSYPAALTTLLGANAVLVTHGAAHKGLHSLALARLGHTALPCLLPHVDRLVRAAMRRWEPAAAVRLLDEARKITMDLNIKHLLGVEPGTAWSESLRLEFNAINDGFTSIPFPFTFLLPFTKYAQALKARKTAALMLEEVIRKRMDDKVIKDNGEKDMVDLLLEADGGSFSMEQKVDFCLNLLSAGYDTTSLTMTLAVKFLTETPTALAQLREEHDSIRKRKGGNQFLEWSDYQSMAFTQCVINETLRVSNIVTGVFRRASTDIHFKDYIIPKGCKIFASFRAVHLNYEHHENAGTFHPWRWQSTNKLQDVPVSNLFTPFGGGPRQCPGNELARVVVSVFLHHLVTRFGWDETEEDKLVFFPTTRTLKGYPINLQLRPDFVC